MQRPDIARPPVSGPDPIERPYPIRLRGPIVKGFQRGSRLLGFPTANVDPTCLTSSDNCDPAALTDLEDGVYYGWVGLDFYSAPAPGTPGVGVGDGAETGVGAEANEATEGGKENDKDKTAAAPVPTVPDHVRGRVFATALSVGMNPYFDGKERTVELYILHDFTAATKRHGGYKSAAEVARVVVETGKGDSVGKKGDSDGKGDSDNGKGDTDDTAFGTDVADGDIFQFYGARANVAIMGYIRPQYNYTTRQDLIVDIETDVEVCKRSLGRRSYAVDDDLASWLVSFDWDGPVAAQR